MERGAVFLIITGILIIIFFFVFFFFYTEYNTPEILNNTVVNVIDGDTFEYYNSNSNSFITIRLLCVDTPEVNQSGYEEAKEYLETLILDKEVILVSSNSGPDKDVYSRLLRYVYVNSTFVNQKILNQGYGELLIIPPEECQEVK